MQLASVFSDHMVLQQGLPVPVWGTAAPGASISVAFAGHRVAARAGADGRWLARLPPLTASREPRELTVASDGGSRVFRDVLVGEVWLCSGQSNMQWSLSQCLTPAAEAAAQHPQLRLFTVPRRTADAPTTDCAGLAWTACTPASVADFSAVGYYFGRELHRALDVPVGLIHASWGGTVAEAWTSRRALEADPELQGLLVAAERDRPEDFASRHAAWLAMMAAHDARTADVENLGFARGWAGPTEPAGNWADMELPALWQQHGVNLSGIFWFRRTVEIPAAWAGRELALGVGAVDKSDVTYFNNVEVGSITMAQRPDAWAVHRMYSVPATLVQPGRATVAVRVHSNKYAGGMAGPAAAMLLRCPSRPDDPPLPLAGRWRYAIETSYGFVNLPREPALPNETNRPSVLFNGMLSFLVPFALRGAIWYQGESNVGRARQYRTLFRALIRDWRATWGLPDLAFHFVQLANYLPRQAAPAAPSNWAELREAQAAALAEPHTGMAVAIDIGDANDIHPTNKLDVGLRLARNALHRTYGRCEVVPAGPLFQSVRRENGALRVAFSDTGGGLRCQGDALRGFVVAGADGKFVWANARIDGDSVVVSSPGVPEPVAVRYAWADNPEATLYNAAGLPAAPFRTDAPA